MIHTKNGRRVTPVAATEPSRVPSQQQVKSKLQNMQQETEQWIRKHPIIGVSIALLAGIGLGVLLKRQK